MVLGFNHNIMYKGEVYHVQTEDSGVANPHIITLLYKGGVIICSQKTSYADILKMDNLEGVVEELMKEQHKGMMRRLKAGEFDERALSVQASTFENYEIEAPRQVADPVADIFLTAAGQRDSTDKADIASLFEMSGNKGQKAPVAPVAPEATKNAGTEQKGVNGLDDAVLKFFGADDK